MLKGAQFSSMMVLKTNFSAKSSLVDCVSLSLSSVKVTNQTFYVKYLTLGKPDISNGLKMKASETNLVNT